MDSNPNSKQPLVSVILMVFNGERHISEQIDSILAQTYANLELIVCDDHSTDRTLEIVRGYAQRDSRVRWVQNARNLNQAVTFQTHYQQCRGEFVAPSDADDFWLPNKLETLVAYMLKHPEVEACFSDSIVASHDLSSDLGSFQKKLGNPFRGDEISLNILLKRNLVSTPVVFFRRELFRKIMPFPEDNCIDYWIAFVGALNHPLGYINQCLVLYRQHEANRVGAETRSTKFYLKRLNDVDVVQNYYRAKFELMPIYERLLTLGGSPAAQKALKEKIANQEVLLEMMRAGSFPAFVRRLIRAVWTILHTRQKYHLTHCLFLAFSWGGIRKLKLHSRAIGI